MSNSTGKSKNATRGTQPTLADRLRSEIAQLEARYDSGAVSPAIYAVLKKLRQELTDSRFFTAYDENHHPESAPGIHT
jgi:hypothetical protein